MKKFKIPSYLDGRPLKAIALWVAHRVHHHFIGDGAEEALWYTVFAVGGCHVEATVEQNEEEMCFGKLDEDYNNIYFKIYYILYIFLLLPI